MLMFEFIFLTAFLVSIRLMNSFHYFWQIFHSQEINFYSNQFILYMYLHHCRKQFPFVFFNFDDSDDSPYQQVRFAVLSFYLYHLTAKQTSQRIKICSYAIIFIPFKFSFIFTFLVQILNEPYSLKIFINMLLFIADFFEILDQLLLLSELPSTIFKLKKSIYLALSVHYPGSESKLNFSCIKSKKKKTLETDQLAPNRNFQNLTKSSIKQQTQLLIFPYSRQAINMILHLLDWLIYYLNSNNSFYLFLKFDIIVKFDILIIIFCKNLQILQPQPMIEGAVQKILGPMMSQYVENFSRQNLKIGLWSGHVQIKEVTLKKDIVKKFNLPFKLKYSRLGNLTMNIPWKSLASSKTEIVIEGLQLLITEVEEANWEIKNTKIIQQRKKQIQDYCEKALKDFAAKTAKKAKGQQQQGYFSKIVTKIIDNLQITVKNIHIRYEDEITKKYAFGVTLQKLQMFTVNKNDEHQFVDRNASKFKDEPLRKRLILSNLGVYWNQEAQFFKQSQIRQKMVNTIATTENGGNTELNYVILMTSKARLFQRDTGKQFVDPQIELQVDFNQLKLQIMNMQLQQIVTMGQRLQKFTMEVKAANRIKMPLQQALKNREIMMKTFIKIYENQPVSQDEMNKYESILQKMEIQSFTPKIKEYLQVKEKQKLIQEKRQKSRGWFSGPKQLTEEEKTQIQRFLSDNFGQQVKVVARPTEYFYIALTLRLKKLQIAIASNSNKQKSSIKHSYNQGIRLELFDIDIGFQLRENGYKLKFLMDDIKLNIFREVKNEKNQLLDQEVTQFLKKYDLRKSIQNSPNSNKYIDMTVQGSPIGRPNIDTDIKVITHQLLVIFDPKIIKIGKDFADIKVSKDNTEAAFQTFGDIKQKTSNAVNQSIQTAKKKFIALDVRINSITLVLYANPQNKQGNCWEINLDKTSVFSDEETLLKPKYLPNEPMEKYGMSFTGLSLAYFQTKKQLIQHHKNKETTENNQIQRVFSELSLDLGLQVFEKGNKEIPKFKAITKLHTFDVHLNKSSYQNLLKMGNCFTIPDQKQKLKQQKQVQKAQEKSEVMKGSRKIGMVFLKQITGWKKYIAVYSGSFIYFYADKKDINYYDSVFTKNAILDTQQIETGNDKGKPYILKISTKLSTIEMGFDQKTLMQDWQNVIEKTNKVETELVSTILDIAEKQNKEQQNSNKIEPVKVDHDSMLFAVSAQIDQILLCAELVADKKVRISVRKLQTKIAICESKIMLKASLLGISIEDNICSYKMKSLVNLLHSVHNQESPKLIDVDIKQLSNKHPQYSFVDTYVDFSFGTLVCNYKTQTVSQLMSFFLPPPVSKQQVLVSEQKIASANMQISKINQNIKNINEGSHEDQQKNLIFGTLLQLCQPKQVFSLNINLYIQEITVSLVNKKTKGLIGAASILGFKVKFQQSNKRMLLKGFLGEILYKDFSGFPKTLVAQKENYDQEEIFLMKMYRPHKQGQKNKQNKNQEIKENPMIIFDIQMLEKPKIMSHQTMFIDVTLKDLQIYYYQQPVLRLITYLNTQMLPSLIPQNNSNSIQKEKNVKEKTLVVADDAPKKNPMVLKTKLQNINVILEPDVKDQNKQLMRLTIEEIGVTNDTLVRKYVRDWQQGEQEVMVDNYKVKLKSLGIYAQYSKRNKKPILRAVTNKMDMNVSAQLIQSTQYYYKKYGQRYQPGMRIDCNMTPFIMRINHDDYNFIMKCVNWCVTFDDRADFYLYDIPDALEVPQFQDKNKVQQSKSNNSSEPIYFNLQIEQLSLAVTASNDSPVSLLALSELKMKFLMHAKGSDITFSIHKIVGTNLSSQLSEEQKGLTRETGPDLIIERGMFNAFGFKRVHKRDQLDSLQGLERMFKQNQIFKAKQQEYPSIYLEMSMDNRSNIKLDVKINELKITVDVWHLLLLSKLAVLEASAQPPKAQLQLHPKAKKKLQEKQAEALSQKGATGTGTMDIVADLKNFMASVSDKKNLNFIVMEGCGVIKMKMLPKKSEQQILRMAVSQPKRHLLDSATYVVELGNFCIYFCKITQGFKNKREILRPIQTTLTYSEFYGCNDKSVFLNSDIEAEVSKIIFEATIKDIIKVNVILQDNLLALSQSNADKQKQEVVNMQQIPIDKIISDIVPERKIVKQGDGKMIRETFKQIKQEIKPKMTMRARMAPIQFTVVNDCNGNFMPVIKFIIQESEPIFSSGLLKSQLALNLTFNLNFFNPRSSKWQPIIEKYQINIVYLTIVAEFGPKTHIILESSQIEQLKQLKFNLSTQFITELMQTLQIAKQEKKNIQQKGDQDYIEVSPYIFQNVTNQTIIIRRIINGIKTQFPLEPGFFGSVRLTDQIDVLDFQIMKRLCRVSLQHYGLVKVPDINYFIEFKVDRLNRFIRFMAPKIITNQTSKSIYCRRYNFREQKLDDIEIKVNSQIPLDNIKYFQCSLNKNSFTYKVDVKRADVTSEMRSQNGKFLLTLVKQSETVKDAQFQNYTIHSTLKIINCLPKDISIQFIVGEQAKSAKEVQAQKSHQVFANENINKMRFQIYVSGFYWSNQFCYEPHRLGEQMTITLRDKMSNQTTLKYIFDVNPQNQQKTFTIFCRGYILSELEGNIKVFGNLLREEQKHNQDKYYPLGGQFQGSQKNGSDKVVLIGFQNGNKIRIGGNNIGYDFSKPIPIGGIGPSQNRVALQHEVNGKIMNLFTILGVDISIKQMHKQVMQIFSRQVVLKNRSIIINNTDRKLFAKEEGSNYSLFAVGPKEKKSFFFTMPEINQNNKLRPILIRGQDTSQCIPLNITGLGLVYFRLREHNGLDSFFKISITQFKGYIFYDITCISEHQLPYQVVVKSENLEAYIPNFDATVSPWNNFYYLNENPYAEQLQFAVQIKDIYLKKSTSVIVKPDDLNFFKKVQLQQKIGVSFVKVSVLISDSKKFLIVQMAKSNDIQDIQQFEVQAINLKLEKISFSFIHNHLTVKQPFESFYFYLHNLEYISQKTNKFTRHQIRLQFMQLDQSQPYVLMNPVVITPNKYKKFMQEDKVKDPSKKKPQKSIFNCLIVMDNTFVQNLFINDLIVQFDDIVIKISQDFIKLGLQLSQQFQDVMNVHEEDFFIKKNTNQWKTIEIPKEGSKTFIKSIKIAPFTVQITAELKLNKKDANSHQFLFLGTVLNALGVVMTNIDGAPISLYGLQIKDYVDTLDGLQAKLIGHYKHAVINQFYKIFGSLNIIGNPVSLFRNVSTGFRDFAQKPAQGLVQGPLEFGKGLAQGTSSLIAHSVGGALNSLEKITGTISSGLAVLTFDEEYEQRRQQAKMKKPKHIFQGLQKGGKAVFYGFRDGVTGVFTKPFEGTKKQGAKGFFKGMAKGVTGFFVKPVTGIFDGASKTTEGLKNTALYLQDKPNQNRIRYPRVFYTECYIVREYDAPQSKLNYILHKSKYKKENIDSYFISSYLSDENEATFVVLTRKHILLVDANRQKIYYDMAINDTDVKEHVSKGKSGVIVKVRNTDKSGNQFLPMPINEDIQDLIAMIETLKNQYN